MDFIYLPAHGVLVLGVLWLGKFLVLAPKQPAAEPVDYCFQTLVFTNSNQDHPIFFPCESEIYGEKVF